jgi:hypothetical protein
VHPSLIELQIDVKAGDTVKAFEVGPDRIGHLVVNGDTAAEAEVLAQELAGAIRVDVAQQA